MEPNNPSNNQPNNQPNYQPVADIIIIGSGPAAFTAGIYAARANKKVILLEGLLSPDIMPGGQLTTTTEVENFPGFPDGIDGFELVDNMRKQAIKFGTIVISETVMEVDMKSETNKCFKVTTGNQSISQAVYQGNSVIIATGATAKKLSFPGSDTYWMKGISACAVCDGALPMFKNQPLAVIGGGDTAMEEATFLSKFGSMVYIIHRSSKLRASKIMQERVFANPKIKILYNHEVVEASSTSSKLEEITIVDNSNNTNNNQNNNQNNNNQTKIKVAGLFYAIGHKPASDFLAGQVKLDTEGYILTEPGTPRTSVPGLFAAGDVQDHKWRQAITAAASGCMAALEAEHYLGSI